MIQNLEAKNTKALYRRAHCYKLKHQYALAVSDLELVCQIDTKNPVAKKELIELKSKLHEEKQTKIKEVASAPLSEPTEITSSPPKAKPAKQTKMLDKDTVEKAAAQASQEASNAALQSIPKTAAGFEKDLKQLKKETGILY